MPPSRPPAASAASFAREYIEGVPDRGIVAAAAVYRFLGVDDDTKVEVGEYLARDHAHRTLGRARAWGTAEACSFLYGMSGEARAALTGYILLPYGDAMEVSRLLQGVIDRARLALACHVTRPGGVDPPTEEERALVVAAGLELGIKLSAAALFVMATEGLEARVRVPGACTYEIAASDAASRPAQVFRSLVPLEGGWTGLESLGIPGCGAKTGFFPGIGEAFRVGETGIAAVITGRTQRRWDVTLDMDGADVLMRVSPVVGGGGGDLRGAPTPPERGEAELVAEVEAMLGVFGL